MTRNIKKMETLNNAIIDSMNENTFDIFEVFDNDYLETLPFSWNTETSSEYDDYEEYDDYSPFEDDESLFDPEWYAEGFNSEADYMHYLGIITGLS